MALTESNQTAVQVTRIYGLHECIQCVNHVELQETIQQIDEGKKWSKGTI